MRGGDDGQEFLKPGERAEWFCRRYRVRNPGCDLAAEPTVTQIARAVRVARGTALRARRRVREEVGRALAGSA